MNPNVEAIKFLVAKGADIHALTGLKQAPIHIAAKNQNPEIFIFLREQGADINMIDLNGRTPLMYASKDFEAILKEKLA